VLYLKIFLLIVRDVSSVELAFLYILKCHVTFCWKCVGARGGVEREKEKESENIKDFVKWECDVFKIFLFIVTDVLVCLFK
jgi:hypothetical protein